MAIHSPRNRATHSSEVQTTDEFLSDGRRLCAPSLLKYRVAVVSCSCNAGRSWRRGTIHGQVSYQCLRLRPEPRWIRHVHLCDRNRSQIVRLAELKDSQPSRDRKGRRLHRTINIYEGDFNARIAEILDAGTIAGKEATFCLLDQRMFECHWQTIEKLVSYKRSGNKIEVFYFWPMAGSIVLLLRKRTRKSWRDGGDATIGPNFVK